MSSFTATKWRFRLALGFLIFAAAAAWAASYYHIAYIFSDSARGNEDVAKLLTLVDILSGSLLAALLNHRFLLDILLLQEALQLETT